MIVVADVEAASRWFHEVFGLASGHGGPEYEMLIDGSDVVAQLHQWEVDEHPHLGDRADPSRGNGILLWFATDDFDTVLHRVEESGSLVLDGPLENPSSDSVRYGFAAPRAMWWWLPASDGRSKPGGEDGVRRSQPASGHPFGRFADLIVLH